MRTWWSQYDYKDQYPNAESEGWMLNYAKTVLPGLDIHRFNRWLNAVHTIDQILTTPQFVFTERIYADDVVVDGRHHALRLPTSSPHREDVKSSEIKHTKLRKLICVKCHLDTAPCKCKEPKFVVESKYFAMHPKCVTCMNRPCNCGSSSSVSSVTICKVCKYWKCQCKTKPVCTACNANPCVCPLPPPPKPPKKTQSVLRIGEEKLTLGEEKQEAKLRLDPGAGLPLALPPLMCSRCNQTVIMCKCKTGGPVMESKYLPSPPVKLEQPNRRPPKSVGKHTIDPDAASLSRDPVLGKPKFVKKSVKVKVWQPKGG